MNDGASKSPGGGGPITYKQAGIDGDQMVEDIRELVTRTYSLRVLGPYGAGLFRLDYPQKLLRRNYKDPVLVACCDGVGSTRTGAFATGRLDSVGIDLVAMNVNDLLCTGAEPLFFLDYLTVGKLDPARMTEIVRGVSAGCIQAGCALLGGETAEIPDFHGAAEFDMAGFAVGVIERRRLIDPRRVRPGDVVIALASSGLHSSGYGLARKAVFERAGLKLDDRPAELDGQTLAEAMLEPTRIYVKSVLDVLAQYRVRHAVRAMAHITGGGLPANLPRVLPEGLTARIRRASWTVPGVFKLVARAGPVDEVEMFRAFNMGVGFVLVVAPTSARPILARLRRRGEKAWVLGKIVPGGPELQWT